MDKQGFDLNTQREWVTIAVKDCPPARGKGQALFMLGGSRAGERFSLHHRKSDKTAEDEKEEDTAEYPNKGYSSVHVLLALLRLCSG
jgi:hypothetical protein